MDTAGLEKDSSGTQEEELEDSLQKIQCLSDHELENVFKAHIPADYAPSAEFWTCIVRNKWLLLDTRLYGKHRDLDSYLVNFNSRQLSIVQLRIQYTALCM